MQIENRELLVRDTVLAERNVKFIWLCSCPETSPTSLVIINERIPSDLSFLCGAWIL